MALGDRALLSAAALLSHGKEQLHNLTLLSCGAGLDQLQSLWPGGSSAGSVQGDDNSAGTVNRTLHPASVP